MTTTTEKVRLHRSSKARAALKGALAEKDPIKVKLIRRDKKGGRVDVSSILIAHEDAYGSYLEDLAGIKVRSRVELAEQIRSGFPMRVFYAVAHSLNIPEKELGRHTSVSPRTLVRRKDSGRLLPDESDRVARIALLLEEAVELFDGSQEKAAHWLKTPKRALGGATPLEYADTEPGAQEVRALIGRLQHGVVV